ncbi:hypothetical protein OEZ78_28855, partial [Leclercia adecarboxylata]|uniref:hypothetical protein n=1 Tax=Leclercia adecarboxylata TaxID=83655 RepID=UPI00234DB950
MNFLNDGITGALAVKDYGRARVLCQNLNGVKIHRLEMDGVRNLTIQGMQVKDKFNSGLNTVSSCPLYKSPSPRDSTPTCMLLSE